MKLIDLCDGREYTAADLKREWEQFREEDPVKKQAYLELLSLVERILTPCIGLLGFSAPDRM